jgi:hypothetical protein
MREPDDERPPTCPECGQVHDEADDYLTAFRDRMAKTPGLKIMRDRAIGELVMFYDQVDNIREGAGRKSGPGGEHG